MKHQLESIEKFQQLIQSLDAGYLLIWWYHDLRLAKIQGGQITDDSILKDLDLLDIVRFRLFNEQREYHGWRSGEALYYRLREDEEAIETESMDKKMVIVGKVADQLKKLEKTYDQKETIGLQTRQYVAYNEVGQAGFEDCRFVKFLKLKK